MSSNKLRSRRHHRQGPLPPLVINIEAGDRTAPRKTLRFQCAQLIASLSLALQQLGRLVFQISAAIIHALVNADPVTTWNFLLRQFEELTEMFAFGAMGPIVIPLERVFRWTNDRLLEEVENREDRNLLMLLKIIGAALLSVGFTFWLLYVLKEPYLKMSKELQVMPTLMLEFVVRNDYLTKYVTILAKTLLLTLPARTLDYSKREEWLHFLEMNSQLVRALLPFIPWLLHIAALVTTDALWTRALGCLSAACYFRLKTYKDWEVPASCWKAWKRVLCTESSVMPTDSYPAPEDLSETCCPICYGEFVRPWVLKCGHPFCERCLRTWFSRSGQSQNKCPLCRAVVSKWDDRLDYSDGSTLASVIYL